jgi:hypothetical protein
MGHPNEGGTMRGTSHEVEPEVDSLCYVDFEDEAPEPVGGSARFIWMYGAVKDVVSEVTNMGLEATPTTYDSIEAEDAVDAGIHPTAAALVLSHTTSTYGLDEEALWVAVERWVNAQGFDTYNSDSRFEVFPAGSADRDEGALTEEALTQLYADSMVLQLAIERGYLTNDQAAELQLEVR